MGELWGSPAPSHSLPTPAREVQCGWQVTLNAFPDLVFENVRCGGGRSLSPTGQRCTPSRLNREATGCTKAPFLVPLPSSVWECEEVTSLPGFQFPRPLEGGEEGDSWTRLHTSSSLQPSIPGHRINIPIT